MGACELRRVLETQTKSGIGVGGWWGNLTLKRSEYEEIIEIKTWGFISEDISLSQILNTLQWTKEAKAKQGGRKEAESNFLELQIWVPLPTSWEHC